MIIKTNKDKQNTSARACGRQAELIALAYLQQQGLILIQQNFYSRFGEIDLIMQDGSDLVFIEVRHRKAGITAAGASITSAKQRKLVKAAQFYLMRLGREVNCRFDACLLAEDEQPEWLKNIIIL